MIEKQIQKMKDIQKEEEDLKKQQALVEQKKESQAKTMSEHIKGVLPEKVQSQSIVQKKSGSLEGMKKEVDEMNKNMKGMIFNIVETIQPAL